MSATAGWRIVVGNDEAGVEYKNALKALLEADPRVASVLDVGVVGSDAHVQHRRHAGGGLEECL